VKTFNVYPLGGLEGVTIVKPEPPLIVYVSGYFIITTPEPPLAPVPVPVPPPPPPVFAVALVALAAPLTPSLPPPKPPKPGLPVERTPILPPPPPLKYTSEPDTSPTDAAVACVVVRILQYTPTPPLPPFS